MGNHNFQGVFNYGNTNANEKHWEKSSVGGNDYNYVDDVDFTYFAGHGKTGYFRFSTDTDGDSNYVKKVHWSESLWRG